MIDMLVERDMAVRRTSLTDRRRITLSLTANGMSVLESARQSVESRLAEMLAALSEAKRDTVVQAMQVLHPIFPPWKGSKAE